MVIWLTKNWLALYGALIATAAGLSQILGYIHRVRNETIRLKLSCEPSPNPPQPPDSYFVTVANESAIPIPLAEAGVIDADGHKHPATRPIQAGSVARWVIAFGTTLAPHDSESARVHVTKAAPPYKAVWVYAMRKDGKEQRERL